MIKGRESKIARIVSKIKTGIAEINPSYRRGPDYYFYKKIIRLRQASGNIERFLKNDYNLEMLYATLVAWDMNSRAAKMKSFDDFRENILRCMDGFKQLESKKNKGAEGIISSLPGIYEKLHLMKTTSRLVSNSKFLHFLFPEILMPMDGRNTLSCLYGNTMESTDRYIQIIKFSQDIINMPENWEKYLDDEWNTTVPKLIDNAIILIVGKSTKKNNGDVGETREVVGIERVKGR